MARVAVYKNGAFRTVAGLGASSTHGRFLGAHNTGVPTTAVLGPPEPGITVTTDGAIIENRTFYGPITVIAADVTIRNCKILLRFSANFAIDAQAVPASVIGRPYSLEIQDCFVDGGRLGTPATIVTNGRTAIRRTQVRGGTDGIKFNGSDVLLEASWVYEQVHYPGTHNDAVQTTGVSNLIMRRNRLEIYNVEDGEQYNACLQISPAQGNIANVLVEDNYMDGGNYTVNGSTNSSGGFTVSNTVWRRNRFGTHYRFGATRSDITQGTGANWDDSNVFDATNIPVA